MASYDSPGAVTPLPGIPDFDPRAGTAHGSTPLAAPFSPAVPMGDDVTVIGGYDNSLTGAPRVTVDAADTQVPLQTALYASPHGDLFTGVPANLFGGSGAGGGKVVTPDHPNALDPRVPRGHA